VCDLFELNALCQAVRAFGPDVVPYQLTDLPDDRARIPEFAQASAPAVVVPSGRPVPGIGDARLRA
jgi:hypothetical protein